MLRTAAVPRSDAGCDTLARLLLDVTGRHDRVALQSWDDGTPSYVTYPELGEIAGEVARGLIALGVDAGDRIAILGLTSADWTIADCGAWCADAVVAPIYHTSSASECAYVLEHSGVRVLFCENSLQAAKIAKIRDRCPALEHIVLFKSADPDTLTLAGLRRLGADIPPDVARRRIEAVDRRDPATIVYTSGTTGPPKGCMLTHENLLATASMYAQVLRFDAGHALFQFLPLAHALARVAQIVALGAGARIIYSSGDPAKLAAELRRASPTHVPAVPRLYEKIHGAAVVRAGEGSRARRALFAWAVRTGARTRAAARADQPLGPLDRVKYRIADRLGLATVRGAFGSRLQLGLIGAAPAAPELLEFFDACRVLVLEGYGLTESCAASTLNTPEAVRFGTVGRPLPGTQLKIAPDGEILTHGPHVFSGYYRDRAATEEVLTADGWLRSGDLGTIDSDGFLTVTGRKKDLIITSSGKNIAPANLERELRDQPYISEAVVFGDDRPYLVALLTLNREDSLRLAGQLEIASDHAAIAQDPRVHAEIQKSVDAVNERFARIEQIKRFTILDRDLTQASGELTPTLKVKRVEVYERYRDLFDGLYRIDGR